MNPGGGNSYLGDGLAQELSARLGRIHGLRVASRTSVSSFKDHGAHLHTIAQRLGVRHILEGSVQREGDPLRVTATLIDASIGFNVCSQTYNHTWQELPAVEDDLARSIMSALRVVLTNELAQPQAQRPTRLAAVEVAVMTGTAELPSGGDSWVRPADNPSAWTCRPCRVPEFPSRPLL